MSSIANTARSGMEAAMTQLGASAHNVANLATPDFRRQRVEQQAVPGAGVRASVDRSDLEGVNLEEEVVNQLQAKHGFLANLAVFKTYDQMAGALLDLRA